MIEHLPKNIDQCFSSSVYQTDKRRGPSFRLIAQDKSMGTPSFFVLPLQHLIKGLKCFLELSLKGVKVFSRAKKAEQANIPFYTIMALFTVIMMAHSDRIAELMNGALNIYKKKGELFKTNILDTCFSWYTCRCNNRTSPFLSPEGIFANAFGWATEAYLLSVMFV